MVTQSKLLRRMVVKACYGLLLPVRLEILLGLLGLLPVRLGRLLFSKKFALLKKLYYLCHDNQSINPHGRLLRGKLLRLIGGLVLREAFPRRNDFFTFLGDTSTEDFLDRRT